MMRELHLHPVAELFPVMPDDEFRALVEDIRANGIMQPIVLHDGRIIDGRHRYLACRDLGIECPTIEWDGATPWIAAQSLNLSRRHLSPDSVYAIRLRIQRQYPELAKGDRAVRAAARERQREGRGADGSGGRGRQKTLGSRDPKVSAPRTAAVLAAEVGVSEATVKRVERVAREAPERLAEVASGAKSAVYVLRELNTEKRRAIQQQRVEQPTGRFQCIVIDPPWPMTKIERDERPNQEGFDYPAMTEEELRAFPVPMLAEEDCHLYCWTTHKHLPMALRLVEHWGFRYQCLLTWVKNVGFTPFSWMYSTEHVVFARRGNLDLLVKGRRLDFAAKVREHSRKPDEFYDLVRAASPGPRVDVFSRESREGFDQYGNQVDHFEGRA